MKPTLTLASPALAVLLLGIASPAHAQFPGTGGTGAGGAGMDQLQMMEQYAPLLETIKKRMGKKRFAQFMQAVGPLMEQMMANQGSGGAMPGSYGAFGSQAFGAGRMPVNIDPQTIMALVAAFEASSPPPRRARTQAPAQ